MKNGIIFEFKKLEEDDEFLSEKALDSALKQIEDKHYADELIQLGITQIDALAVVIDQKKLWMKTQKLLESA